MTAAAQVAQGKSLFVQIDGTLASGCSGAAHRDGHSIRHQPCVEQIADANTGANARAENRDPRTSRFLIVLSGVQITHALRKLECHGTTLSGVCCRQSGSIIPMAASRFLNRTRQARTAGASSKMAAGNSTKRETSTTKLGQTDNRASIWRIQRCGRL